MKISAITYLVITTFLLITVTVFTAWDFPFNWVFYLTVLGQVFLVISDVKVLKDEYTTIKDFEDFYEDYPIGKE